MGKTNPLTEPTADVKTETGRDLREFPAYRIFTWREHVNALLADTETAGEGALPLRGNERAALSSLAADLQDAVEYHRDKLSAPPELPKRRDQE